MIEFLQRMMFSFAYGVFGIKATHEFFFPTVVSGSTAKMTKPWHTPMWAWKMMIEEYAALARRTAYHQYGVVATVDVTYNNIPSNVNE